jgi:hypothetical protein
VSLVDSGSLHRLSRSTAPGTRTRRGWQVCLPLPTSAIAVVANTAFRKATCLSITSNRNRSGLSPCLLEVGANRVIWGRRCATGGGRRLGGSCHCRFLPAARFGRGQLPCAHHDGSRNPVGPWHEPAGQTKPPGPSFRATRPASSPHPQLRSIPLPATSRRVAHTRKGQLTRHLFFASPRLRGEAGGEAAGEGTCKSLKAAPLSRRLWRRPLPQAGEVKTLGSTSLSLALAQETQLIGRHQPKSRRRGPAHPPKLIAIVAASRPITRG